MHPTHWLISTQACATRDADGNAPLHFALVRCAAPEVVDVLVRARPGACGQRGFLGRLPLQLARLYGAAASTLEVLTCVEIIQRIGRSHFSAMARPSWLG